MPDKLPVLLLGGACALFLGGCAERALLPVEAGMGPQPELPPPQTRILPTVKVAKASGWPQGTSPTPAPGLAVQAFATGLQHPRSLHVLPNGDVLVAESDAPPRQPPSGLRDWFMKRLMQRAGSGSPSPNRIILLRDSDGDGKAETRSVLLQGLNSPFGMALVGNTLYVANTDAVLRFPYQEGITKIEQPGVKVADLPAGSKNHHWTKDLIASRDGKRLYATVGSNSNAAEDGMEIEANRAAILEIDPASGSTRLYASGLRNPNGLAWNPDSGALWVAVNERDELGSDLVPDYMTSVREGGFYGWPYSYYGRHVDERVKPQRPELVERALIPDYALGSHTASLGMTFYTAALFPSTYAGGAFVGQHGSWNRNPPSGYKVIFVPFAQGKPAGAARDVLTGFLGPEGEARGRPVGVAVDKRGALLVADDVGNTVWRVTPAGN